MQAVIFIGIQGAGKSTFFQHQFFATHIRINLDMLRTRTRERRLFEVCLETRQPFVVDNTNPQRADRARYIPPARAAGFRVIGYYFPPEIEDSLRRNLKRPPAQQVPNRAILATVGKMEGPSFEEGFDALFQVRLEVGRFVIEEWKTPPTAE